MAIDHSKETEARLRHAGLRPTRQRMAKVAQDVRENIGHEPELVTREGKPTDQILQLIEEDRDIAILVLAASSGKDGPGPLVSSVSSRGTAFPIPVTIVPDTLTDEEIAALA